MNIYKKIEWILRLGVFGTYLGHGLFAISVNPKWIIYLNTVGFSDEHAIKLMPVIGSIDIMVALIVLIKPLKPVVLYATVWALLTALIRPLSGEPLIQFIERSANWAAPLALFILMSRKPPNIESNREE